ncbi:MAG: hypothetical protein JNN07_19480 [Verrucomicrobiales bacterium]|nr:hypothetical protein [Verrucomicrobiales bacterium]
MKAGDAGTQEASRGNDAVAAWDAIMRPIYAACPEMCPPAGMTGAVDFPGWWWCAVERVMGIKPMEEWGKLPRPKRIRQYGRLIGQAEAMFKYHRGSTTWRNYDRVTVAVLEKVRPAMEPWLQRAEENVDLEISWARTLSLEDMKLFFEGYADGLARGGVDENGDPRGSVPNLWLYVILLMGWRTVEALRRTPGCGPALLRWLQELKTGYGLNFDSLRVFCGRVGLSFGRAGRPARK